MIYNDIMYKKFIAREESSIIDLRKFHNWIKRELLRQTVDTIRKDSGEQELSLLDLAVGKGGDMLKWYDNRIMKVVGFDIDGGSIQEAKRRYDQMIGNLKRRGIKNLPNYEFYVMDLSKRDNLEKIKNILGGRRYNIVSCQFAIHYFFRDRESLENLVNIVGTYIGEDGYFIGTSIDGEILKERLNGRKSIGNNIFTIEKKYIEPIVSAYGNMYLVELGEEGDTEHYFANKGSEEYVVNIDELKIVAKKMNLLYVGIINFETWYQSYGKGGMTPEQMAYSFLNFSFVFKKIM